MASEKSPGTDGLLNCDYKIASKAIANGMKTVLPELIPDDQSGFIKNRCITDNIRTLDSVTQYTANKNIPGLVFYRKIPSTFWLWPLAVN